MKIKKVAYFTLVAGIAATAVFAELRRRNPKAPDGAENNSGITITAHTGCMDTEANSVESIIRGFEENADIVEIDLRFAEDGTPIMSHDSPTGGEIPAAEAFKVLAQHKDKKMNIDVKTTDGLEAIPALAEEYGVTEQIFFTGIDENMVEATKEKCPGIPYYINMSPEYPDEAVARIKELGGIGLNSHYSHINRAMVAACHEAGLLVSAWTCNGVDEIKRMINCGVDNITTRRPDRLFALLAK